MEDYHKRIETMDGIFKEGEMVTVKLICVDPNTGKFKVSKKALMPKPESAPKEATASAENK